MPDLVHPGWYEYTYPEERGGEPEFMRLDVIVEGALESVENYIPEDIPQAWNDQVSDLQTNHRDKHWSVCVYDERSDPPEKVQHLEHLPSGLF